MKRFFARNSFFVEVVGRGKGDWLCRRPNGPSTCLSPFPVEYQNNLPLPSPAKTLPNINSVEISVWQQAYLVLASGTDQQ